MIYNFFEKFFTDSFIFDTDPAPIMIEDVIIVLFWSIILSFMIALTYRSTHRGVSYSQSFTQTLVLLGMIVAVIMVVIGSDIARAFTLVGALSIVRFRNALKETRDVGFIFFTMAVGMACGTRFYLLSILFTAIGCTLLYVMTYTKFGQKGLSQDIIELNFPVSEDYVNVLSPIFTKYLKYYSMLGIDSVDAHYNRISFIITFKKRMGTVKRSDLGPKVKEKMDPKSALLFEIQQIPFIKNLKIIDGSSSVEI